MPVKSPGPVPADALEYFLAKKIKPSFDHRDVWRAEHATIFTVAKTSGFDVVEDMHEGIRSALKNGTTLAQFKRDLIPLLQKKGWWGVQEVTDPVTGERRLAQLGSPRRLRTIYQANLRTARAAGQWQRIQRTKQSHPFLLYNLGPSERHRPEHASWAGIMLPVDDPWIAAHPTPGGYGCKCWYMQVSRARAERFRRDGIPDATAPLERNPTTGLPTGRRTARRMPVRTNAPDTEYRNWVNKRTGEIERVPVGITPGWNVHPSRLTRGPAAAKRFMDAAQTAAPAVAASAVPEISGPLLDDLDAEYRSWVSDIEESRLQSSGGRRNVGIIEGKILQRLEAVAGVKPETAAITIEQREISHLFSEARKGTRSLTRAQTYNLVRYLAAPRAIIWDGAGKRPALLYVFDDPADDRLGRIVVRINFGRRQINAIRSGARVPKANLEQPGMIRLDGGEDL